MKTAPYLVEREAAVAQAVIGLAINNRTLATWQASLPAFPGVGLDVGDWSFWRPLSGGSTTIGVPCVPNEPC